MLKGENVSAHFLDAVLVDLPHVGRHVQEEGGYQLGQAIMDVPSRIQTYILHKFS